nr:MAG TPA: hypothetical protein [Caudoviricetes sp.]
MVLKNKVSSFSKRHCPYRQCLIFTKQNRFSRNLQFLENLKIITVVELYVCCMSVCGKVVFVCK